MQNLTITLIKEKAVPILKEAGVNRASVFGSMARGEATEKSDVDILVDFPEGKSLFDFVGLKLDLEDALHRKVDLVDYGAIKPILKPYIMEDEVAIL